MDSDILRIGIHAADLINRQHFHHKNILLWFFVSAFPCQSRQLLAALLSVYRERSGSVVECLTRD